MRYGAIDIGSNAVRLMVKEIREDADGLHSDKVAYTRIPIRLGSDVFGAGRIGPGKQAALTMAIQGFKSLLEAMEVVRYRACATSAMREAENGNQVVQAVRDATGVTIEIIKGGEEADLIFSNFSVSLLDRDRDYLYIDVGGGSTELTFIRRGERLASRSFRIGSVRLLKGKVSPEVWAGMASWCRQWMEEHGLQQVMAIGTGGNINQLSKLARGLRREPIPFDRLVSLCGEISEMTCTERMNRYGLKPNRADVIEPAGRIYLDAMSLVGAEFIEVPKVGLGDGMILQMHRDGCTA